MSEHAASKAGREMARKRWDSMTPEQRAEATAPARAKRWIEERREDVQAAKEKAQSEKEG